MTTYCHCGAADHRLHLRPRDGRALDAEILVLAPSKRRVVLMIGRPGAEPIVVDGTHRLRQLARALLRELGEG